jgi:F-type H+-transporting ATPase subunit b
MRILAGKLALLALVAVFACGWAKAQSAEPAHDATVREAPTNAAPEQKSEEDQTEQFKHSASVRLLARATGLSLDNAYWVAVVLNFAIVAGVIWWASKKNLPAMFRSRTASIQKSLDEARRASEDANRRLSDIESRLARLGDEINGMRAMSEKEAAVEEERIKASAAEESQRIVESARQEITAAEKAARRELTAYAADLAVTLASKQIRVDTATDQALVRRFAQQLSGDGSGAKKN